MSYVAFLRRCGGYCWFLVGFTEHVIRLYASPIMEAASTVGSSSRRYVFRHVAPCRPVHRCRRSQWSCCVLLSEQRRKLIPPECQATSVRLYAIRFHKILNFRILDQSVWLSETSVPSTRQHGVTAQNTELWVVIAVGMSNLQLTFKFGTCVSVLKNLWWLWKWAVVNIIQQTVNHFCTASLPYIYLCM
jgi:hypothetical protein